MNTVELDGLRVAVVELDSCASTQDEAARLLPQCNPRTDLLVVRADHQTGGRGREGRTWIDTPGSGLLVTLAPVRPQPLAVLDGLARVALEALRNAVLEFVPGLAVECVEPNDLYVGDRKLAGVLVDARTVGHEVHPLLIGVGLNIAGARDEIAGRLTTSLGAECPDIALPGALELALAFAKVAQELFS